MTGFHRKDITVHATLMGGGFGRRSYSDYVAEAVMVAKAMQGDAPLKLVWTREDDMRAGFYRPMSVHQLEAALDPLPVTVELVDCTGYPCVFAVSSGRPAASLTGPLREALSPTRMSHTTIYGRTHIWGVVEVPGQPATLDAVMQRLRDGHPRR